MSDKEMSIPKQGDTVYVIATCKDTLKRGSGVCYFQEFGGCPYLEGRALNYCGEREDVPGIFESVVDTVKETTIYIQGLSFGNVGECAPLRFVGKRIFTECADAEKALAELTRKRLSAAVRIIRNFCNETNCTECPFYDESYQSIQGQREVRTRCMFNRDEPSDWESEEYTWKR